MCVSVGSDISVIWDPMNHVRVFLLYVCMYEYVFVFVCEYISVCVSVGSGISVVWDPMNHVRVRLG